ncbi:MAG: hypothetical protein U0W65_07500 [Bacteroidia bacterium]
MKSLIFIIFLFLLSCQKSGNGYVKGTVTESATGNPIEGVPIFLIQSRQEAKGQSTFFYDTINRTVTNSDGTYFIKYHNSSNWSRKEYINVGLIKNYSHGNGSKELIYKKTAVNFSLY